MQNFVVTGHVVYCQICLERPLLILQTTQALPIVTTSLTSC